MVEDSGKGVVLVRRENSMVKFRWTGAEPDGMFEVEVAEGLGARWEGDELVTYDLPGMEALYRYHEGDDDMSDND